jgi:hypothetical protein
MSEMGKLSPASKSLGGRYANEMRFHPEADHTELERDYAASKLEDAARETVANWPPLTPGQIDRIAGLLRSAGDASK